MQRGIVLLVMLLLLIDLGLDGCLGKAALVPPDFSQNSSLTSPSPSDAGKVDFHFKPSMANNLGRFSRWQFQPVTLKIQSALKIITYCHTNSSGGIPL
jgi:hypothetical protein